MNRKNIFNIALISLFAVFLIIGSISGYEPEREIRKNFFDFTLEMLKLIPFVFILIGLFEVWIKEETIKKHLGENSGTKGYFWVTLLAGVSVGGLVVAFPVAYSLYSKGAKLSIIFYYIGAAAICRIPMTIFEASFLGIEFTLIRYIVSIPLLIITSVLLGNYLSKRNYKLSAGK